MGAALRLPLLLLLLPGVAYGAQPDSTVTQLNEVIVEANSGPAARITSGGNVRVSAESLRYGSRLMGEADLLVALKRVGGVSSVGDYGSGLVIQGNDPSQVIYRVDGAPVFFPYRFGGVFSTFNTSHFNSVSVMRYGRPAATPSRLGAVVDVAPRLDYFNPLSGSVNVGLLASTVTVRTGVKERFALSASGRISYIDALYGRFLNNDVNANHYNFGDINLSAGWRIDSLNYLTAGYFFNSDKLHSGNNNYAMNTRLRWRNNVASLRWTHRGRRPAEVTAYYSEFGSRLNVGFPQFDVTGRAAIASVGASGKIRLNEARGFKPGFTVGGEASGYSITPLWAELHGEVRQPSAPARCTRPWEARAFADAEFMPAEVFKFSAGLSVSTFSFRYYAVDPRFSAELRAGDNCWNIGAGRYSQYLHLIGFSEIGLASNFWLGSGADVTPQRSWDFSAGWSRPLMGGDLFLSASLYYKIVSSQSEYSGQVLDIIDADYDAAGHIFTADGYNTGLDIGIQKRFGRLTGSASYSFGRAMRHLPGSSERFHSLTDAGHQFKADAEFGINSHWSVSAAFVYSSGRVYTPTRYLYIIANRLIAEYGARNSGRMPDYQRLDLSGTYRFRTGGRIPLSHTVNISLINAYGHRNVESQFFAIDGETMRYKLYRVSSLYRFLPSVSYSIDF